MDGDITVSSETSTGSQRHSRNSVLTECCGYAHKTQTEVRDPTPFRRPWSVTHHIRQRLACPSLPTRIRGDCVLAIPRRCTDRPDLDSVRTALHPPDPGNGSEVDCCRTIRFRVLVVPGSTGVHSWPVRGRWCVFFFAVAINCILRRHSI